MMVRIVFNSGRILDLDNVYAIFMDRISQQNPNKAIRLKYLDDCQTDEYLGLEDWEDREE